MPFYSSITGQNLWLGTPKNGQHVIPQPLGMLEVGQVDPNEPGTGNIRLVGAQVVRAAAAGGTGLATVLPDRTWIAGEWTQATTTYTDDTANAQSGTSNAMVPVMSTVNNGIVIGSLTPFNVIGFDVTTAATGLPVYDTAYWGYPITGSQASAATWQTVTQANNFIQPTTPFSATGEVLFVLNHGYDLMVKTTSAVGVTGFPNGFYAVRIRATTAETVAVNFARLYIGYEIRRETSLAQNSSLTLASGTGGLVRTLKGIIGIAAYFNTVTSGINSHIYIEYE